MQLNNKTVSVGSDTDRNHVRITAVSFIAVNDLPKDKELFVKTSTTGFAVVDKGILVDLPDVPEVIASAALLLEESNALLKYPYALVLEDVGNGEE